MTMKIYWMWIGCCLCGATLWTSCQRGASELEQPPQSIAVPHAAPVSGRDSLSPQDLAKITQASGKTVEAITFGALEARLAQSDDQLLVCNFWATWCQPCVAEMPYFEQLQDAYASKGLKVLFVSLDNPAQREGRVTAFVRTREIRSECVLLDERERSADEWITALSASWQGDIPATLFISNKTGYREFYPGAFEDFNELKAKVLPLL